MIRTAILMSSLAGALFLHGCAADGGLAGKGKPIDKAATLQATCTAISTADGAFQSFAAVRPGLIDANGMNVEGAAVALFYVRNPDGTLDPLPVCKKDYTGDIDAAIGSALNAWRQISALIAAWQH